MAQQQQRQPIVIINQAHAMEIIKKYNNHKKQEALYDAKKRAGHTLSLEEIDDREKHYYASRDMKVDYDAAVKFIETNPAVES